MKDQLRGLGVALVTPFRQDASIDFPALEKVLEHVVQGGVQYLVILGTTGEAVTLSQEEKKAVVNFVTEHTEHKLPVIVGIGGNNTGQVVDQIKSFPFGRIDGILSVAPYYNKPTARGLYEHYRTLAAAAPVPVILYNVPGRTGVNIPAETILELAHTFDNIVAVKEASGNLNQVIRIAKDKPEKFLIISGDDALTVPIMSVGGAGVISVAANAWPAAFRQITDAALAGNFPEAAAVHYRFATMIDLLFADGNPGGIKAVLSELGLIGNHLRLPLVPVREEIRKKISKEVKKI